VISEPVLLLDFESRSRADLKVIGGRNYWTHASTEAIVCVATLAPINGVHSGEYWTWYYGDPMPDFAEAPVIAAHNARNFDRFAFPRLGWPEPRLWLDTSEMARASGLPGKLADLGERLAGLEKDSEGNRFTLALSQPSRAKATLGQLPELTRPVLERVAKYCKTDVEIIVLAWPHLEDFAELEPRVAKVWHEANDRGLLFDSDLARALLDADAHAAAEITGIPIEAIRDELFVPAALARGVKLPRKFSPADLRKRIAKGVDLETEILLAARLQVSALRHAATFCQRIREAGGYTDSAQYDDVEPLTRSDNSAVADLARHRLALASIASGKLRAGLARVSPDGRMRDNVRYYGAHTGRGAGGGMQWQNFPHPEGLGVDGWSVAPAKIDGVEHPGWDDDRVCAETGAHRLWNQAEISMLLRACAMAPPGRVLVAADFSGIEARGNAWAAGDAAALALFRAGGDAYKPLACRLFSIDPATFGKKTHFTERDTSKKAELGCGYQMGAPKFKITAEKGGMVWRAAAECQTGPGSLCSDPICGVVEQDRNGNAYTHGSKIIVDAWREMHPDIVNFWYALERAAVEAVDGRTCVAVDCAVSLAFDMVGKDLALVLPSGRPVVYRNAAISEGKFGPQVRFYGPKGYAHLYGGRLCENAVQSFSRDKLVEAMVNADDAGLDIILTVHDEIVAEVEAARAEWGLRTLSECMTRPSEAKWDEGFPIAVEGFIARRYRK